MKKFVQKTKDQKQKEETMKKILDGSLPDKEVVAALYDEVKFPPKSLYDN